MICFGFFLLFPDYSISRVVLLNVTQNRVKNAIHYLYILVSGIGYSKLVFWVKISFTFKFSSSLFCKSFCMFDDFSKFYFEKSSILINLAKNEDNFWFNLPYYTISSCYVFPKLRFFKYPTITKVPMLFGMVLVVLY